MLELFKQNSLNTYAVSIYAHELQVDISATELSCFSQRKLNVRSKISHVLLDNDVFQCLAVAIADFVIPFVASEGRGLPYIELSEFVVYIINPISSDMIRRFKIIVSPLEGVVVLWCNG